MKGLDAGVLESILEGDPAAKELLRRLRGLEVATTELTILELTAVAHQAPARVRTSRLASIEKLRHKLTVLPIDSRATAEASRRLGGSSRGLGLLRQAEAGAFEAVGCDELFTHNTGAYPGKWSFDLTRINPRTSKTR